MTVTYYGIETHLGIWRWDSKMWGLIFDFYFFGLLILDYHFHALVSCKNKFGKIINNFRIDLAALGMNPCWWCFLRHAHMNLKRFSWILIKGFSKTAFVAEDETGQRVSHLENEKKIARRYYELEIMIKYYARIWIDLEVNLFFQIFFYVKPKVMKLIIQN